MIVDSQLHHQSSIVNHTASSEQHGLLPEKVLMPEVPDDKYPSLADTGGEINILWATVRESGPYPEFPVNALF